MHRCFVSLAWPSLEDLSFSLRYRLSKVVVDILGEATIPEPKRPVLWASKAWLYGSSWKFRLSLGLPDPIRSEQKVQAKHLRAVQINTDPFCHPSQRDFCFRFQFRTRLYRIKDPILEELSLHSNTYWSHRKTHQQTDLYRIHPLQQYCKGQNSTNQSPQGPFWQPFGFYKFSNLPITRKHRGGPCIEWIDLVHKRIIFCKENFQGCLWPMSGDLCLRICTANWKDPKSWWL